MSHPMGRYKQGRSNLGCFGVIFILGLVLGLGVYWFYSRGEALPEVADTANTPTVATNTTPQPMVTTAPLVTTQSTRRIYFPNAETSGTIVDVFMVPGGWDVSNLQELVGHLEGTSWLGDSGNTVLAGHFEDELGRPGPFRYLYFAEVGDRIFIQEDGVDEFYVYEVTDVFRTDPSNLEILRKTDTPQLTLITCDGWSYESAKYEERLVVIAKPIGTASERVQVSDETTSATISQ